MGRRALRAVPVQCVAVWAPLLLNMLRIFPRASCSLHVRVLLLLLLLLRCTHHRWVPTNHAS